MLYSLISLLLTVLFVFYTARIDFQTLEYSYIYSHSARFKQRALFFICMALYSYLDAIGGALIFAALFDQVLNKMRGIDLMYLGSTALWDKFWKDKILFYIAFKVIILGLGIYLILC